MEPGTYTLLVELADDVTVGFGAAGTRDLRAGWYAYTGSAFGPGGLSRVSRHRRVATGESDTRHWHVDYLLGLNRATIRSVWSLANRNVECPVSSGIDATAIRGIGATDCSCETHLRYRRSERSMRTAVERAYADVSATVVHEWSNV